jgi:hypothetical protein
MDRPGQDPDQILAECVYLLTHDLGRMRRHGQNEKRGCLFDVAPHR